MTRYADAYIMALFPRSSYRAADDHEPQVVTAGVSPDLWVSVAVYKLVCAVDGLIEPIVNTLRKRLAALGSWYRYRVKPAVRRWVDDYLAATKENGA